MKRTLLPAALLAAALSGCGGGQSAVDDTASPAVDGIPKIGGETTAEPPGGEIPAPTETIPGPSSADPGTPPPPPTDLPSVEPPAGETEPTPPVTPPSP